MKLKEIRTARLKAAKAEAKRFTSREVARYMGVSAPTYRKWEEADELDKVLTVDQADRLAGYFNAEPSDLLRLPKKYN